MEISFSIFHIKYYFHVSYAMRNEFPWNFLKLIIEVGN